ncbi:MULTISPECIES: SDR family NAD(P)-dependent oxidoreductase [Methanoculleus]|jgi:NAD(P)-dependent dehydrogenase (short-subunit alcohol dehydrogenase family)|uniref:NAD(P)-dependent dehydrogenase, short-chain alcohol dehydrogenase family n=1 Tax=Methanoculleus thermophilus TaxID=2200 RepID=A0A1G8YNZ4_9EURY|nr:MULTISPECIES: SDR family NAD(P)-dependent oxidoreductase [Methanoculleus]NLN08503.1 SDR family NAD(P)-dependent oxidoreductase [Methanoculleus thermophilus]SDK04508.1 NAD(P)-dependent dehydrogenase, short-chain alcohol dehydrogenase family [Methanoculleus thermophilus]HQD25916.1 SDR family NAD(P)-dependent oxidoreductase [Methanoculleus thermophilus]
MAGQTILVTGSTDGIGKATARALASLDHYVLLHGRNHEKGERVLAELKEATGSDRLSLYIADLSVQDRIRRLAEDIAKKHDRLDVLINNAGVFMPKREVSPDGIEMTFAVNYLAQVLLTHELLPLLRRSAPARIVNVASIAHRGVGSVDWGNLPGFSNYDPYDAYAVSKVGIIAFTIQAARVLEGTGVTANCLHPGVIDTKLLRAYIREQNNGSPPERGAEVETYLALSPDAGKVSGRYFEENRWTQPSSLALDPKTQDRFWKMALDLTGIGEW